MRAALINDLPGSYGTIQHENIWKLVSKYALDGLILQYKDANRGSMDYIHGRIPLAGINVDHNHNGVLMDEFQMVDAAHGWLNDNNMNSMQCITVFNYETEQSVHIEQLLAYWRSKRPTRATIYAPEPYKAGFYSNNLVDKINGDQFLRIAPELYRGNMYPCDAISVRDNLLDRGIRRDRLISYHGAVSSTGPDVYYPLPENMNGLIFYLEKLPL